jgi:hypothetical protein
LHCGDGFSASTLGQVICLLGVKNLSVNSD